VPRNQSEVQNKSDFLLASLKFFQISLPSESKGTCFHVVYTLNLAIWLRWKVISGKIGVPRNRFYCKKNT